MTRGGLPQPGFNARDRGKSLPRLHKAHFEGKQGSNPHDLGNFSLSFETYAANPLKVGPMKPLQGPTPVGQ